MLRMASISADFMVRCGAAFAVMITLELIVKRTWFGKAMRALSQNEEAARLMGLRPFAAFTRVALPLARPAIAAGVALALMETLADFGAEVVKKQQARVQQQNVLALRLLAHPHVRSIREADDVGDELAVVLGKAVLVLQVDERLLEPREGVLPRGRLHQVGSRPVLPRGRRRCASR